MDTMKRIIIALFILIVLLPSCKFIRDKGWFGSGKDTLELYQMRLDSIRVVDSLQQAQIFEIERLKQQALTDSILRAEEEQRLYESMNKYHIIVGSFITPEYAVDHAEFYTSLGYDTKIYKGVEGFDLVSAMDLNKLSEALILVERFRDTVEIDAWLYIFPQQP